MMTSTATATRLRDLGQPDHLEAPEWLAQARASAFSWLAEHGFPTQKNEDWKYLRLGPILDSEFRPGTLGSDLASETLAKLVPDLGGTRLVFVNGHLHADLSTIPGDAEGLTIASGASLMTAQSKPPPAFFDDGDHQPLDGFAALNVGLANDGAFIVIAAGVTVEQPIQIVYCSTEDHEPMMSTTRTCVAAEPGSRAVIVETHVGNGTQPSFANTVTRIRLGQGAHVEHHMIQNTAPAAVQFGVLDVTQATDSRFSSNAYSLGASTARHEVRVRLEGEAADVTLAGLYLPSGRQHHDNPVTIEHVAPRCTSRQIYNGVLDEQGHGVFNGRIIVQPSANGTDAAQSNRNLVLSDRAEIDTRPRLEILTDDVTCAHGATVGQLDEDAIYYLRTRGIPESSARAMLTTAFANEIVQRIDNVTLRSWVEHLVSQRLNASTRPAAGPDTDLPGIAS